MAPLSRQLLRSLAMYDVVPGSRLRGAGATKDSIAHAVRTEKLVRVHRDVFALTPSLGDRGRWLAAVLACGESAALSHLSAAALWALIDYTPRIIEVTVPRAGGRKDPLGLRVHRSRILIGHTTLRQRIEVTSLARTLDDCAGRLAPRSRVLRALLERYVAGQGIDANELEARFYALCVRAGLPRPQKQTWLGQVRRVDFLWPGLGLTWRPTAATPTSGPCPSRTTTLVTARSRSPPAAKCCASPGPRSWPPRRRSSPT